MSLYDLDTPQLIDPVEFAKHFWPDLVFYDKQEEIIYSVVENDETYVPAGNALGKDFVAGFIALWWFCSRRPARVVTTSVKMDQLEDVLWGEIRRFIALSKYKLPIQYNHMKIRAIDDDGTLYPNAELVGQVSKSKEGLLGKHSTAGFKPIPNDVPRTLVIFDEACHDDQTEVMTEQGWKLFKDVVPGERLLTMNPYSWESKYTVPKAIYKSWYEGQMIRYKGKGGDIQVTPNHRMWRCSPNGIGGSGPWSFIKAGDLSKARHNMARWVNWDAEETDFTLPAVRGERKNWEEKLINGDDWAVFLAWYCSEGHLTLKGDTPYVVGITQKDPDVLKEISDLCVRMGYVPKHYPGCSTPQIRIHDRQLAEYLFRYGKTCLKKRVPDWIKFTSAKRIRMFLETYVRGDGYTRQNDRNILYTSSKKMADDLQELALKAGAICNIHKRKLAQVGARYQDRVITSSTDGWVVSFNWNRTYLSWKYQNTERVEYKGMVYCASVPPDGLLLTRRNGYPVWSGNSGIEDDTYNSTQTWAHRKLIIGNPFPCNNFFRKGVVHRFGGGDMPRPKGPNGEHRGYYRKVIKIRAEDSPNVILARRQIAAGMEPTNTIIVPGVKSWAKYCQDRVLWDPILQTIGLDAEFYEGAENLLYPPEWLNRAEELHDAMVARKFKRTAKAMGVDPAAGGDKTAIAIIDEFGLIELLAIPTPDTSVIPTTVLRKMREYNLKPEQILFDLGGGGQQHVDRLRAQGYNVKGVGFGEAVSAPLRRVPSAFADKLDVRESRYAYYNRRAEMYGDLSILLDPASDRPQGFALPRQYDNLRKQMSVIPKVYEMERLKIPPKDKKGRDDKQVTLKELIGHSPDELDALVLAVHQLLHKVKKLKVGAVK